MNFPAKISLDTQLILDELRKLSAKQSELFADLAAAYVTPAFAFFSASVSPAPAPFAAVSPVPATSIIADNWSGLFGGGDNSDGQHYEAPIVADDWGGLFDAGHNSDEQHGEARSIVADNWDGLFEQPAHILVEPAAIDAADGADIVSIDVFGYDQISKGNGLTSTVEYALLNASEELVLPLPCGSESASLTSEREEKLQAANIVGLEECVAGMRALARPPRLRVFSVAPTADAAERS